jgi:methyl-accepting chemotaxis protein
MPEISELLSEWRQAMESIVSSAAAAASRTELPGDLLRASQRQLELLQEIVDAQQRLQGNVVDGLLGPVEAVFDLLQESGATMRKQAETMESAGRALQETATLMKQQAELFERVVSVVRQPTDIARAAAKGTRRPAAKGASRKRADGGP